MPTDDQLHGLQKEECLQQIKFFFNWVHCVHRVVHSASSNETVSILINFEHAVNFYD